MDPANNSRAGLPAEFAEVISRRRAMFDAIDAYTAMNREPEPSTIAEHGASEHKVIAQLHRISSRLTSYSGTIDRTDIDCIVRNNPDSDAQALGLLMRTKLDNFKRNYEKMRSNTDVEARIQWFRWDTMCDIVWLGLTRRVDKLAFKTQVQIVHLDSRAEWKNAEFNEARYSLSKISGMSCATEKSGPLSLDSLSQFAEDLLDTLLSGLKSRTDAIFAAAPQFTSKFEALQQATTLPSAEALEIECLELLSQIETLLVDLKSIIDQIDVDSIVVVRKSKPGIISPHYRSEYCQFYHYLLNRYVQGDLWQSVQHREAISYILKGQKIGFVYTGYSLAAIPGCSDEEYAINRRIHYTLNSGGIHLPVLVSAPPSGFKYKDGVNTVKWLYGFEEEVREEVDNLQDYDECDEVEYAIDQDGNFILDDAGNYASFASLEHCAESGEGEFHNQGIEGEEDATDG
ncbi:hypothetical protein K458DRAFT_387799 [Lentithecium fluviatile CBS 122367]|uniref:Uncharacterized protein n=1 Tax=Lentithecium fluviatile CBS 122367 TaxID=1168545 RepID=A0A6G1J5Q1_9PLEO|nr:hypothetical protein K458DRAFT_387799 [Lentithecium fluviatile CBS 122367]